MLRDFEYGLRKLLKQPGFTLIAILALALGIGANTATFSILNAVVLRPLPYEEPDRLVKIWATAPEQSVDQTEVSWTKFRALAQQSKSFEALTAYHSESFNLTDRDNPESVEGQRISSGFFDTWKVEPILGRRFTPAEDQKNGPNVVLLSQGLWERRFGSDRSILNKAIQIEGVPFTIVGVMPEKLRFPFGETQVWVPRANELSFFSEQQIEGGSGFLFAAGRLKDGVTIEQAAEEATRISNRYAEQFAGNIDSTFHLKVVSLTDEVVGPVRFGLFLLLGAVVLVLLIACADVANLLLAQGLSRRHEFAIRMAMGATRSRILRQMLAEGILLSLIASVIGVLLASWGLDLLVASSPANVPRIDQVGIDGRVLAFTLTLSLLTGVIFSLLPAFQTTRTDAKAHLKENSRGSTGGVNRNRMQGWFVTAEVALALVLLIGAGLLIQSFRRLSSVETGLNAENLLVTLVTLPKAKYPGPNERRVFFEQIVEQIERIPGIESAAGCDFLPIGLTARTLVAVEGRPLPPPEQQPVAWRTMVQPGFFHTVGARMIRGREFDPKIAPDSPLTGIINEAFVRQYFPGENPIGKIVLVGRSQQRVEVVGVVNDIKRVSLDTPPSPEFYLSARQSREVLSPTTFMSVLIRTSLPPERVAQPIRDVVRGVDREQPITDIQTMDDIIAESISKQRLTMSLLSGFSAAALVLCILGIYGVVAHTVSLRKKEIGVRMALGAQTGHVLSTVTRQGLKWVMVGVVFGLVLSFALVNAMSKLIAGLLFEVSATDPVYFMGTPLLLTFVALIACYLPARRATRIEPAITLRTD